jgi:hypothetical protein
MHHASKSREDDIGVIPETGKSRHIRVSGGVLPIRLIK